MKISKQTKETTTKNPLTVDKLVTNNQYFSFLLPKCDDFNTEVPKCDDFNTEVPKCDDFNTEVQKWLTDRLTHNIN